MDLLMVYPEHMYVSEERARGWLADAIANREVDDILLKVEEAKTLPIEIVVQMLMDTGKFTFAQQQYWRELTTQ